MNDSKKQHRITRRDLQELIFTARVQVVANSVLLPLETFFSLIKTAKKVSLKATTKEINNKCINPSKRLILENNKKKEGKKRKICIHPFKELHLTITTNIAVHICN